MGNHDQIIRQNLSCVHSLLSKCSRTLKIQFALESGRGSLIHIALLFVRQVKKALIVIAQSLHQHLLSRVNNNATSTTGWLI